MCRIERVIRVACYLYRHGHVGHDQSAILDNKKHKNILDARFYIYANSQQNTSIKLSHAIVNFKVIFTDIKSMYPTGIYYVQS